MNRKSISMQLAFLLVGGLIVIGPLAADQWLAEPDPDLERILWSKADLPVPRFIPAKLLEGLDLTSRDTVDLSHLPLTEGQAYTLEFALFAEPEREDGCFSMPIASRRGDSRIRSLELVDFLSSRPLTVTGVVRKVVPGWATGIAMPANLIFVEVEEALRDTESVAFTGGEFVFVRVSGAEFTVDGRRFCSPKTEAFEVEVGNQVLLFGVGYGQEPDAVLGQVFEIRGDILLPGQAPGLRKDSAPIQLDNLRRKMAAVAGSDR